MTRQAIVNKMRFRYNCRLYRLDWNNFEIYDDLILLNTSKENVFVLFDKNFNTIGIEKKPSYISKEKFVKEKYFKYSNFTDSLPYGLNLGYPFEKYTLKNIVDLSNRIEVIETNQGHSIITKVNGDWYKSENGDDTLPILSYIKFLGLKLEQYYIYKYQMYMLDFEIPDEYSYLSSVIEKVTECIQKNVSNNLRPFPDDILCYIGEQGKGKDFDCLLFEVADLLMKDQGFKVMDDSYQDIEKTTKGQDLTVLATKLLKLLDLTDEELKKKEELQGEELIEKQLSNLRAYINEDIDDGIELCKEEKGPTLVKKKNQK